MSDDEYEKLRARYRDKPKSSAMDVLLLVLAAALFGWVSWFVWEQHAAIEQQHIDQRAMLQRCHEERAAEKYWNCKK